MGKLSELDQVIQDCKKEFKAFEKSLLKEKPKDLNLEGTAGLEPDQDAEKSAFQKTQEGGVDKSSSAGSGTFFDTYKGENLLIKGEATRVMSRLLQEGYGGQFATIYLDPPFFSNANYAASVKLPASRVGSHTPIKIRAYKDRWEEKEYFRFLTEMALLAKALLKDTGLLWLHLDWHNVHGVKLVLDEIFGASGFINEIIWQYKSGGSGTKHFARKHDTILLYGKTKSYHLAVGKEKSYNRGLKPYRFKGVEEFQDQLGWYTLVNQKDVWDIDMVGRTAAERTGYATQKPRALLTRILESGSNPGDLVGDFCCGSGVLAEAAALQQPNRQFVCADAGDLAVAMTEKRLLEKGISYRLLEEDLQETHHQTLDQYALSAEEKQEVVFRFQEEPSIAVAHNPSLEEQCSLFPEDRKEGEKKPKASQGGGERGFDQGSAKEALGTKEKESIDFPEEAFQEKVDKIQKEVVAYHLPDSLIPVLPKDLPFVQEAMAKAPDLFILFTAPGPQGKTRVVDIFGNDFLV